MQHVCNYAWEIKWVCTVDLKCMQNICTGRPRIEIESWYLWLQVFMGRWKPDRDILLQNCIHGTNYAQLTTIKH